MNDILFVGHSLVGVTMPNMLNAFIADQGLSMRAEAQIINGSPLRYNWDNGQLAQGVNAREVLPSGGYGTVVITEGVPLADQIRWNDTEGYAKRYYDLAVSANADTQFYLYQTWPYIGEDTAAWRAQITQDLSAWEGIVDHINDAGGGRPALLVPAGQAMGNLHDAIAAGQVPGLSSIRDLFTDDIHLSDLGNWFIAALQAEVLLGIDAAQVPLATTSEFGAPYDGPDAALAAAMNNIIDQTLSSYGRDGIDDGGTTDVLPDMPGTTPVDTLEGDAQNNTLIGDDLANLIQGFDGNDTLTGGLGDDTLAGGSGWDRAVYSGAQSQYTMTLSASGTRVEDRRAEGDGSDLLQDMEEVQFQSKLLDLTQISGTHKLTAAELEGFIELYIGYFNRAPDAVGLNFWGTAHANDLSLEESAALFIDQDETRDTYPDSMGTDAVVTAVYDNILGRTADAAGFAFWTDALDSGGVGRDQLILALLEGAKAAPAPDMPDTFVQQQIADQRYLSDKTDIGAYFSVHLGMTDVDDAAMVMDLYDGSQSSFDRAIARIDELRADMDQSDASGFLMPLIGVLDTPDWA